MLEGSSFQVDLLPQQQQQQLLPQQKRGTLYAQQSQLQQQKQQQKQALLMQEQDQSMDLEQSMDELAEVDDFTTFMYLCDHEKGFPLMLQRVKQAMASSKEASLFMRKKAQLDEEYGLQLSKLVQQHGVVEDGKAGTYNDSWRMLLQQHDQIAKDRIALSENIRRISDELQSLHQNTEKSRKQIKVAGVKCSKKLTDAEQQMDKLWLRYENATEEWERATQQIQQFQSIGFVNPVGVHGYPIRPANNGSRFSLTLGKNKGQPTTQKLHKNEEECRQKVISTSEAYKAQISVVKALRDELYVVQLPKLIKALKDVNSDIDGQLKDRIADYADIMENGAFTESIKTTPYPHGGIATNGEFEGLPPNAVGMSGIVNLIDNTKDFVTFIDSPSKFSNMVQRSPKDETPSFGKTLNELMDRDLTPVPIVLNMLLNHIEEQSLITSDLYRVNGNAETVRKIEVVLDKCPEMGLSGIQYTVYDLSSTVKLFLRKLPDSIIPRHVFEDAIRAARNPDKSARVTAIHEIVNSLSDAHYATLQRVLGHLKKTILSAKGVSGNNHMSSAQGLSFVFGPLLMDQGRLPSLHDTTELSAQCFCIETLLENFNDIFLSEDPEIGQEINNIM